MPKANTTLTIETVQKALNESDNYKKASESLACCPATLAKFIKVNKIIFIPKRQKHTEETKQKISINKIKFYKEHPEKHNWKRHNKFKSVPCEKLKLWMKNNNILFIEEYSLDNIKRNFSIDIAFPDKQIGIEINGNQHYNPDGTLKSYYQERHNIIESVGWKLYELHYSVCFHLDEFAILLPTILNSPSKIQFDYFLYKPKAKKNNYTPRLNPYPSREKLLELLSIYSNKEICLKLNVNYKSFMYKCHKEKIKTKDYHKRKSATTPSQLNPLWRHIPKPEKRKVIRPSKEELTKLVWSKPSTTITRELGLKSSTNIRRWCKIYNISKPPRGYWRKVQTGKLAPPAEVASA